MKRGYKRDGRYPRRFSVSVTAALAAKLDAAAVRYGIAPATWQETRSSAGSHSC